MNSDGEILGSGVRITKNEAITAYHVVEDRESVQLAVVGVGLKFGTVTGYDMERNITLLTFSGEGDQGFHLAPSMFKSPIGSEVVVVGFVPEVSRTVPIVSFGRISALWNVVPGDHSHGQVDVLSTSTMRGGAVFDRTGRLLGIVVAYFDDLNQTVYLDSGEIDEVIDELREGQRIEES
ncbi:MAG: serine protease [Chloroflexi bacterium]|nr:serine protease [Chloroflexota bacterium]MCY3939088.1 serine protease [Chloroflexota bacterium]